MDHTVLVLFQSVYIKPRKTTQYYSVCTCAGPKKNYIISFHLKWGGEKSPLLTQVEIEL